MKNYHLKKRTQAFEEWNSPRVRWEEEQSSWAIITTNGYSRGFYLFCAHTSCELAKNTFPLWCQPYVVEYQRLRGWEAERLVLHIQRFVISIPSKLRCVTPGSKSRRVWDLLLWVSNPSSQRPSNEHHHSWTTRIHGSLLMVDLKNPNDYLYCFLSVLLGHLSRPPFSTCSWLPATP